MKPSAYLRTFEFPISEITNERSESECRDSDENEKDDHSWFLPLPCSLGMVENSEYGSE
jgi:hypothetical protein